MVVSELYRYIEIFLDTRKHWWAARSIMTYTVTTWKQAVMPHMCNGVSTAGRVDHNSRCSMIVEGTAREKDHE